MSLTGKHRGLIGVFGEHLVKTGLVAPELGRSLNTVENTRSLADYSGNGISFDDASWVVETSGPVFEHTDEGIA